MADKIKAFVAYPSEPPSLAEIVEAAILEIQKGQTVDMNGWKNTAVGGKFIINEICRAIDESNIFICELTHLNHNVLFELGYAIAKKKRVWILIDSSIEKAIQNYNKFKILTTIGHIPYTNSKDIVAAFYKEQPYKDLDNTIYKEAIESVISFSNSNALLYLKSEIETEASIKLSRRIEASSIKPIIVDDPREEKVQTLQWYAKNVYSAYAVVVHLLSRDHIGWYLHNAKNSFVSGIACGFGKYLIMLAHEPYQSPVDYRDLLKTHSTAMQCESLANSWLGQIEEHYRQRITAKQESIIEGKAYSELQSIFIGDSVAERETYSLPDYFVVTAAYNAAKESSNLIVVGRKGSGKTAILYKLVNEIGSDVRNHICVIKPIAYELEGIMRMLRQTLPTSEKGFLIESFWKFLIYTELAKSLYDFLKSKPVHYQYSDVEDKLVNFVDQNASIITPEFSIRLERVVGRLQDIGVSDTAGNQRVKISELLHSQVINKLRAYLGQVLENKHKVIILVDNLDKAWSQRGDIGDLCSLLFGCLDVSRRISVDFEKSDYWRRAVNLSLIIFLRSDIFSQIVKIAPERDKLSYFRITWEDPELLIRVLEERFLTSQAVENPKQIWSRYFCSTVKGIPTRDFILSNILPRPRDLIYFCKAGIDKAINRRHTRVEEEDILEAQKQYSQYVLGSLNPENGIQLSTLESLLYEFVGGNEIVDTKFLIQAMNKCGIPSEKLDDIIQLLCDLTFLGQEIEKGRFEFLFSEADKEKYQVMARKTSELAENHGRRFRIHQAFHPYLEIVN